LHGRDPRHDAARFCTHCGEVQDDAPQRVCERCGYGVILTAARDALGPAFLVVTLDLRITAASAAVADLLGESDELVVLPLQAVLSGDDLPRAIGRAALGSRRITTVSLSANITGRRHDARIAWCGHPPAALVVLN
jgi:PAS domain-containing protein